MPLLPALPIFHSSSSSKLPYSLRVRRSSTLPAFEIVPCSTCQPFGRASVFHPRQALALASSNNGTHSPGGFGMAPGLAGSSAQAMDVKVAASSSVAAAVVAGNLRVIFIDASARSSDVALVNEGPVLDSLRTALAPTVAACRRIHFHR